MKWLLGKMLLADDELRQCIIYDDKVSDVLLSHQVSYVMHVCTLQILLLRVHHYSSFTAVFS